MAMKISPVAGEMGDWSSKTTEPTRAESKSRSSRGASARGSGGKGGSGGVSIAYVPTAGVAAPRAEDPYWETMRAYYDSAYAEALQESEETARRAAQTARDEAERQNAALTAEYAGLDRQLYRDYMEQRRTLPQELAARGYTGGVSESARVRLRNGYEEALAENTRSRLRRSAELDAERSRAEERAYSEAAERSAKARQSWQQNRTALLRERHGQEREEDLRKAQTLAAAGDFSGYRAQGWTEGEIGYLSAVWAAKNPEVYASLYAVYA